MRELSFAPTTPPSTPAGHSAGETPAQSTSAFSFVPLYTVQQNMGALNTIQLVHTPVPPHARVPFVDTSLDSFCYSTIRPTYARPLSSKNIEMINVYLSTDLGFQPERTRVASILPHCTDDFLFSNADPFGNMPDMFIDVPSMTNIRRYNDTLSMHTLDCTTTAAGSTQPQQLDHDRVGLCTGFSLQYNLGLLAADPFFNFPSRSDLKIKSRPVLFRFNTPPKRRARAPVFCPQFCLNRRDRHVFNTRRSMLAGGKYVSYFSCSSLLYRWSCFATHLIFRTCNRSYIDL